MPVVRPGSLATMRSGIDRRVAAAEILHARPGEALVEEWRALAERRGSPYLTPEWWSSWLRHHPADLPFLIVVRDSEGAVAGLLPLVRRRRGRFRLLCFAGDALGDDFGPLCAEGVDPCDIGRAAGAAIDGANVPWDIVVLAHVEDGGGWHRAFTEGLGDRVLALERRRVTCPRIAVRGRSWDDILSGLSRNARKETRRRRRRIDEDPSRRFRLSEPGDVAADTEAMFRLHDLRWEGREPSSIAAADLRASLLDFNRAAAERDWLRLWILELDGAPVAAELAWRVGDRMTLFQGGFDPAYSGRAVGIVLFTHALARGAEEGASVLDLSQGTAPYKLQFADGSREAVTLLAVRADRPLRYALQGALLARRAARALEPRVRRAAEALGPIVRRATRAARAGDLS